MQLLPAYAQGTPLLPAYTPQTAGLMNRVHNMDCFDLLRLIPAQSVDAIITDLPYGTTACSWDVVIPFAPMWAEVKRVLKPRGVFVTTASQPFTSALVMSNPTWFRYEWIWEKSCPTGHLNAYRHPMKAHEDIAVFSANAPLYFPQYEIGEPYRATSGAAGDYVRDKSTAGHTTINTGTRLPRTILRFDNETGLHGTQKPLGLFKYLIRTYTQPNDLILDFCCGSGTTLVAAQELGRHFIGGDTSEIYCEVARKRLAMPYTMDMFAMVVGD